jgi:hypothetical protein
MAQFVIEKLVARRSDPVCSDISFATRENSVPSGDRKNCSVVLPKASNPHNNIFCNMLLWFTNRRRKRAGVVAMKPVITTVRAP